VLPTSATKPPVEVEGNSSTLPFTGAEIVGLSVLGLAVIGAGTVLVLAGRKRKHAA
jgi:LPXTG-motif cell wall-anchored protein